MLMVGVFAMLMRSVETEHMVGERVGGFGAKRHLDARVRRASFSRRAGERVAAATTDEGQT